MWGILPKSAIVRKARGIVRREGRTFLTMDGATMSELESFMTSTGATSFLPGDAETSSNPAYARIRDMEGGINVIGLRSDCGGSGFTIPPPSYPE